MNKSLALPSTLTVSEARTRLYDLVDEVGKFLRRFVITHRGKPTAVVLPVEDLESWEETMEILSNKKLMRDIRQAEKDYKAGKYYTLEEVEKSLNLRLAKKSA